LKITMRASDLDSSTVSSRPLAKGDTDRSLEEPSIKRKVDQQALWNGGDLSEWPRGDPILDRFFLNMPSIDADDRKVIVHAGQRHAPILPIRRGFAYRSYALNDHQRTTTDIMIAGDIAGLDQTPCE
jgi:hypothetical protein